VYRKDGGNTLIVASGGVLDVESGGSLKIAGTAVTASAADLNSVTGGLTSTDNATFTIDNNSVTGKIIISAIAGAADKSLTLRNTALTDDRIITFPDATGTVALTTSLNLTAGADGTAGTLTI